MRWLLLVLALGLAGCRVQEQSRKPGPLRLVATTGMIGDALHNIAPRAEVVTLMGPGVDPHLYKATQGDLERLLTADMVVYNGLHLEGKMAEVLAKLGRWKPTYALGEHPALEPQLLYPENSQGQHDPHIWFDVRLWRNAVAHTGEAVALRDSLIGGRNSAAIRQATAQYCAQLDSLDQWVRATLAQIPPERRILVTAHDAFGYFGHAYQIEVRGLQGISTVAEAGLRNVNDLVDLLVTRRIPALFVESSVSPQAIAAVVAGCRARGHDVRIGGTLYSDAMGNAGTPAGNYIGMVTANVRVIAGALGGIDELNN